MNSWNERLAHRHFKSVAEKFPSAVPCYICISWFHFSAILTEVITQASLKGGTRVVSFSSEHEVNVIDSKLSAGKAAVATPQ